MVEYPYYSYTLLAYNREFLMSIGLKEKVHKYKIIVRKSTKMS